MKKGDKILPLAAVLLSLMVLAPALSWAQYNGLAVFMKIDGIPGESTDAKHKDWMDVFQYKGGIDVPGATFDPSGGQSAPVPKISPVTIQKLLDKATPKLHETAASGHQIKFVTIEFVKPTGPGGRGQQLVFQVKLTHVFISSVSMSASGNPGFPYPVGIPQEFVSVVYGKIEWTYYSQRPDGTIGTVYGQYDLLNNIPQ